MLETKKTIIPITECSAVVHHLPWLHRTVRIDYLLEWDERSYVSLQSMVNSNGVDVPQRVNHCTAFNDRYYVFLVYNAKK